MALVWDYRREDSVSASAYVNPPWTKAAPALVSERPGQIALDFDHLEQLGFITPSRLGRDLARDFSAVKRRLFRRLDFFQRKPRPEATAPTILVTSGNPGEGKTFSAINLAFSLAIEDQLRVLLIDTDLAKPSIPVVFGYAPDFPGLFDRLTGALDNDLEIQIPVSQLPLTIVPAGHATVAPASLLGGRPMADFLSRMANAGEHDVLVLDGPPLLATTEAAALVPHATEVVLVVGAGMANRRQIAASLDLLEHVIDRVSLLLNRAVFSDRAAQYGNYGYGRESAPQSRR